MRSLSEAPPSLKVRKSANTPLESGIVRAWPAVTFGRPQILAHAPTSASDFDGTEEIAATRVLIEIDPSNLDSQRIMVTGLDRLAGDHAIIFCIFKTIDFIPVRKIDYCLLKHDCPFHR